MRLINNYWFRWFIGGYLLGAMIPLLLVILSSWLVTLELRGGWYWETFFYALKDWTDATTYHSEYYDNYAGEITFFGLPVIIGAIVFCGSAAGILGLIIAALKHWFRHRFAPNHRRYKHDNL